MAVRSSTGMNPKEPTDMEWGDTDPLVMGSRFTVLKPGNVRGGVEKPGVEDPPAGASVGSSTLTGGSDRTSAGSGLILTESGFLNRES